MIHNEDDYRRAMSVIEEERERIDGHAELWKRQGMTDDEIKRLRDPMMCVHLQFVEEAEAWRKEHDGPGVGIKECADGFAVSEPQPDAPVVLYYGKGATASRMDMFHPDELFPTREEAEARMLEMWPEGGCMGPPPPDRDKIKAATNSVLAALRRINLLEGDEESMCQPMAESRRRVLWLLEKAVEEVLIQDACENF